MDASDEQAEYKEDELFPYREELGNCETVILLQEVVDEKGYFIPHDYTQPVISILRERDHSFFSPFSGDGEYKLRAVAYIAVQLHEKIKPGKTDRKIDEGEDDETIMDPEARELYEWIVTEFGYPQKFEDNMNPIAGVLVEKHLIELTATVNFFEGLASDFRISHWRCGRVHDDLYSSFLESQSEDSDEAQES